MTAATGPWDLTVGIDRLCWGQGPAEVHQNFPRAAATRSAHGRDPTTGNEFYVEPGLAIDKFLDLPGLRLIALLGFADARLVVVDLIPRATFGERLLSPQLKRALTLLSQSLGVTFDLTAALPSFQSQQKDGIECQLLLHRNDFMVSVVSPECDPTWRQSAAHRGFRRIQGERGLVSEKTIQPKNGPLGEI